MVFECEEKGL